MFGDSCNSKYRITSNNSRGAGRLLISSPLEGLMIQGRQLLIFTLTGQLVKFETTDFVNIVTLYIIPKCTVGYYHMHKRLLLIV